MTGHDHERRDDLGAYLLGALSEQESAEFERHLATCHDCRDEADRLRGAVNALARSVEPLEPPKQLKRTLLESARAEPPEGVHGRAPRKRSAWRALLRPELAWVSAVLLLAFGGAGGFAISQLGDEKPEPSRERVLEARVDRDVVPGASARLVLDRDSGSAQLRVRGMPVPRDGAVYELWLRHDGGVEPAGVFTVDKDGRGHGIVQGDLAGADVLMVTRERAGGVKRPTNAPLLSVDI